MAENYSLEARHILRHLVATLAYRATRVIEDPPAGYADHCVGEGVKTPLEILSHISMVLEFALSRLTDSEFEKKETSDWDGEVERFYATLEKIDRLFKDEMPDDEALILRMVQGPLSDSLTHVGQLAMLRRLAGSPVKPENFMKAQVQAGRVGRDQPALG